MKRHHRSLSAACLLPLLGTGGSVFAASGALEEVIVTAQKRAESLQDTPVSVTAFSSRDMETLGVLRAADVAEYTPNLTIAANTVSNAGMAVGIRGLQTADAGLATDSRVGLYLDGVYLARVGSASFDVVDIEQIEVLRGPQGTLWGKNTTGGAINIRSAKPSGQFGLRQDVSVGNFSYLRTHTTLDTGSWQSLSAKLTFDQSSRDGDVRNRNDSSKTLGETDNEAFAIALHWQPTDRLRADYSLDMHNRNGFGPHLQLSAVNPTLAASPTAILAGRAGTQMIANPFHAAADLASHERQTAINATARRESIDLEGHNLTLTYDFDQAELKSITAYRAYWGEKPADFDGGSYAVPIFEVENTESQHQWSQEFQLSGSALYSRLDYVAGLFYFREKASSDNPQNFLYNAGFTAGGLPILAQVSNPLRYETDNQSVAAYTQVSYVPALLEKRLRVTGGLRYTRDEKDSRLNTLGAAGSESWSSVNPALTLEYQLGDDANVYAKVSTGYNAGIFNIRATSAEAFQEPVDEETLINYEVGFKSEWLDRRVRLNGALFTMDFEDMHVSQFVAGVNGASNVLRNAGEARIRGVELELTARVNENLQLNAGWGHTDFDYREFITRVDEVTGTAVDSANEAHPALTPRNTVNAGMEYFFDPLGFGSLSLRLDATYTGSRDFHPFLTRHISADSRTLLNGRLTLEDLPVSLGALRVGLWGKNLTDEEYRVNGIDFGVDSGALGFAGVIYGPRRSVGIDLVWEYQ